MKSPWKDNKRAFAPMFDEQVVVVCKATGNKTTMNAAIFVDGTADPLTDEAMDTQREDIILVFDEKCWPFIQTLRRGDTIKRLDFNGRTYKVSEAKLDNCFGWCLTARSV